MAGCCRRRLRHLHRCLQPSRTAAGACTTNGEQQQSAAAAGQEPSYSLQELAQHSSRRSCWVGLHGGVYDMTAFLDEHPGGARGVLRHAGTDATALFGELHSDSIFLSFAPAYRIGALLVDGGATATSATAPTDPGAAGVSAAEAPAVHETVLASPFPHDRFEATGCERLRASCGQSMRCRAESSVHSHLCECEHHKFREGAQHAPVGMHVASSGRSEIDSLPIARPGWSVSGLCGQKPPAPPAPSAAGTNVISPTHPTRPTHAQTSTHIHTHIHTSPPVPPPPPLPHFSRP